MVCQFKNGMVYPPATSEAGARRPAIIQLEQFKEASSKPAQLWAFTFCLFSSIFKKVQISLLTRNYFLL
jgi:hypothetical protein